ncbi:FAD:protein FMN transferase [Opitutales bacterium ASA1]|uniref:FAD:protein FMN transferase n=1 Tax=Congregicoccus parvus TaxID=3081749 RepID=UPI002B31AC0E|nr:FAD:protein FMN transferase [Opitutales bacterium ASA1]
MENRVLVPPAPSVVLPVGVGACMREVVAFTGLTMGTTWRASVVLPFDVKAHDVERWIVETLEDVVARMSPWVYASDLARFRRASPGSWVPLGADTLRVLQRALEIAALTDGVYDPTIGRLVDVLGFGPGGKNAAHDPGSLAAQRARAEVGFRRVRVDAVGRRVYKPAGVELDLCSIAKGFGVDRVIERLGEAGVESCFVEIGGEARGRGCKPDGQPWWCAIESPRNLGDGWAPMVLAACGVAVATSGNGLRRRACAHGSIGHIVDPRLQRPRGDVLETVTVLATTCMEADAWATALFLLGPERGMEAAEAQGLAALFVSAIGCEGPRERWTRAFAAYLE